MMNLCMLGLLIEVITRDILSGSVSQSAKVKRMLKLKPARNHIMALYYEIVTPPNSTYKTMIPGPCRTLVRGMKRRHNPSCIYLKVLHYIRYYNE